MNQKLSTQSVIHLASERILQQAGHVFDVFSVAKPATMETAENLVKIVSKLSPLVGNLIEFRLVELLNEQPEFKKVGKWKRQDPGFPDTVFEGDVLPQPGLEVKAWFPLATEITARFKDSQNHFAQDQTHVALLAWIPDQLIFGRPILLDACVVSCLSVAKARDEHYHKPPYYLVVEPEDTTSRTRNLQQTNTNGYRWQGSDEQLAKAKKLVDGWGPRFLKYDPSRDYQTQVRQLMARFPYRLDTNFAKMDRIVHADIEAFKRRVLSRLSHGRTLGEWSQVLFCGNLEQLRSALSTDLQIK